MKRTLERGFNAVEIVGVEAKRWASSSVVSYSDTGCVVRTHSAVFVLARECAVHNRLRIRRSAQLLSRLGTRTKESTLCTRHETSSLVSQ